MYIFSLYNFKITYCAFNYPMLFSELFCNESDISNIIREYVCIIKLRFNINMSKTQYTSKRTKMYINSNMFQ